jgi:translation initiation factor IF-3
MRTKRRPPPPPQFGRGGPQQEHRINRRIRIPRVQVIDAEGVNHGEVDTEAALKMAEDAGLDLVEVSPTARPPVCKIMNYGQYKYSIKKKAKGQKAHQAKIKGIRLHPSTAEHDVQVAMRKATQFLEKGDKVLIQVLFKGRELAHTEMGDEQLQRFVRDLADISKVESPPRREGKRMHLLLAPLTPEERNARKKNIAEIRAREEEARIAKAKELAAKKAEAKAAADAAKEAAAMDKPGEKSRS